MAQSILPGDLITQPNAKIVFKGPFRDYKRTYYIKLSNPGRRRIGWALKTTNSTCVKVEPAYGVSGPKESLHVAVSCYAVDFPQEDTRITIEWDNTPKGATQCFRPEWLQGLFNCNIFLLSAIPTTSSSGGESSKWDCPHCTYHNDDVLTECSMCGLPREKGLLF